MATKPFQNGQRKISIIVSTIIGVLIFLGSLFMATKALIEDYALYRIHTDTNTQRFMKLETTVNNLQNQLPHQENQMAQGLDDLKKMVAVLQTQVGHIHSHILQIEAYQSTIRKELKEVAENKLNTSDYWREHQEVMKQLDNLERPVK